MALLFWPFFVAYCPGALITDFRVWGLPYSDSSWSIRQSNHYNIKANKIKLKYDRWTLNQRSTEPVESRWILSTDSMAFKIHYSTGFLYWIFKCNTYLSYLRRLKLRWILLTKNTHRTIPDLEWFLNNWFSYLKFILFKKVDLKINCSIWNPFKKFNPVWIFTTGFKEFEKNVYLDFI